MRQIILIIFVIIVAVLIRQFAFHELTGGAIDSIGEIFDPRAFVTSTWDASTDGKSYKALTAKNWHKYKCDDVYFRDTRNKSHVMHFQRYDVLPNTRETEYMRRYRVDRHALGDNAFLMSPFLREWQRTNIYNLIKANSSLFDIGVGDGRSRDLWLNKHLTVYGVEPGAHVQRLIDRRLPRVMVKQTGGEDPAIRDWVPEVDYVMMSYSITFFYRDPEMFSALVKNLELGREILIIGMDGAIVDGWPKKIDNHLLRFEKHYTKRATFGNTITISIKSPTTLVDDQTEYLVDFEHLIRALAPKYRVVADVHVKPAFYFGDAAEFIRAQRFIHFSRI